MVVEPKIDNSEMINETNKLNNTQWYNGNKLLIFNENNCWYENNEQHVHLFNSTYDYNGLGYISKWMNDNSNNYGTQFIIQYSSNEAVQSIMTIHNNIPQIETNYHVRVVNHAEMKNFHCLPLNKQSSSSCASNEHCEL